MRSFLGLIDAAETHEFALTIAAIFLAKASRAVSGRMPLFNQSMV
jgi:hypothetical protein